MSQGLAEYQLLILRNAVGRLLAFGYLLVMLQLIDFF